jgi:hypothetical protein
LRDALYYPEAAGFTPRILPGASAQSISSPFAVSDVDRINFAVMKQLRR